MTTRAKTSGFPDTLRSSIGMAMTDGDGRAMANATQAWFVATAECQRELTSFISKRLEKDGETARGMMACRSPAEFAALHSRWMEETLRDYNAEMGRLMTIYTNSINGAAGSKGG